MRRRLPIRTHPACGARRSPSFPFFVRHTVAKVAFFVLGIAALPLDALAEVIELGPEKVAVERVRKFHSAPARSAGARTARVLTGFWVECPVSRFGLADSYWEEVGELSPFTRPVGYSNRRGSGRDRCQEGLSHTYVTRVQFPVNLIPEGWEIVSATLRYTEANINAREGERFLPPYCQSVTGMVGFNVSSFRRGRRTIDSHRLPFVTFYPLIQTVPNENTGGEVEIDATMWVRYWQAGFENHGISIYGRDHRLKKNNKACVADIGQAPIRLEIEWQR